MKVRHQFVISVFLLLFFSNDTYDMMYLKYVLNDDIDVIEKLPPEEIFIKYQDTLSNYFGNLEIDLLEKYRQNQRGLKTDRDFQVFFRNAITLRESIDKTFRKHAKQLIDSGYTELPDMPWFEEVVTGMDITKVKNNTSYHVIFDYTDFRAKAARTVGKSDDLFLNLMDKSYDDQTHYPKWLSISKNGISSLLGSGKHLEILELIDEALEEGDVFYQEIYKVKGALLNDILFSKVFYHDYQEVLDEIEEIESEIDFDDNERKLINTRLNNLAQPEIIKEISFNLAQKVKHS